mgnify:CR=1 FL=1
MEKLAFIELLDKILLSDDVVNAFHKTYKENNEFKENLLSILPEIELCKNQEQNNPWHKYNVLDHILHSVEEMNKQTKNLPADDRRLLSYAMFYHDTGKPACHIVREKDGKMIDSFFDHNIESEKIVDRTAKNLNFNQDEIDKLKMLVLKHDIFMGLRPYPTKSPFLRQLTFKVVKDEISDLDKVGDGLKLIKFMVLIGRSDNKAQNEQMTEESLKLIDNFEHIVNKIEEKRNDSEEERY